MSEYFHVEKPFLDQLAALDWSVIDQGHGIIPTDPSVSLRTSFRQWLLPDVFRDAVRSINRTDDGTPWLTDRQLDDLRDQLLRQPNLGLLIVRGVASSFLVFLLLVLGASADSCAKHPLLDLQSLLYRLIRWATSRNLSSAIRPDLRAGSINPGTHTSFLKS